MKPQDFLVELGTEELPPTALQRLATAFEQGLVEQLKQANLSHGEVVTYAAPRRLAIWIKQLATQQPDSELERRGPAVQAAFDKDGNASKAAEGFARSVGVSVDQLDRLETDKGSWLYYKVTQSGKKTNELLPEFVSKTLEQLPIPKRMRWGSSRIEFVRPVQWLLMILGGEVVPASILGKTSSNLTYGHRFHAPGAIEISRADQYESLLETQGKVFPSFNKRKAMIRRQVTEQGQQLGGAAVIDEDLLDEVTALNEWPVALAGRFDQEFLSVPSEALVSSMKEHQKYFHVVDDQQHLMANFITIANLESKDPQQVIAGNEKVIRPRLADAAFFWNTDLKTSLESRVDKLKTIVFQHKLGTLYDKAVRISGLTKYMANELGADGALVQRAALLAKTDLVTEMVYEFPDLQGIAGMYYARQDGEHADVALAMNEQYLPRQAGDQLPSTETGMMIALADRLDSLVGLFGIGQPPTGTKDPFALRRASLGVLRILVEKNLNLDLRGLLEQAVAQHQALPKADGLVDQVLNYMLDRFSAWYQDENIPAEVFQSVRARQLSNPLDINHRVQAVYRFSKMEAAPALAAANKRVSNILAKQSAETLVGKLNHDLLTESAEQALATAISEKGEQVAPLFAANQYAEALEALASLREPVDAFFDQVMVMADDEAVKNNRLLLLTQLRNLFLAVADISCLQGQ